MNATSALIDSAKMVARYVSGSSDSDAAARNKTEEILVYAATVDDFRADVLRWGQKAWLVQTVRRSRWAGEESPEISQSVVIGRKMPTPMADSRFGDAVETRDLHSPTYHLGTVIRGKDDVAVLLGHDRYRSPIEYRLPIRDRA